MHGPDTSGGVSVGTVVRHGRNSGFNVSGGIVCSQVEDVVGFVAEVNQTETRFFKADVKVVDHCVLHR